MRFDVENIKLDHEEVDENQPNPIFNVIVNIFGQPRKHNRVRGQVSYNCPICDDNKNNLEINYNKLVMKCWKCCDEEHGLKGTLRSLIKKFGSSLDLKTFDTLSDGLFVNKKSSGGTVVASVSLPKEFIPFMNGNMNSFEYKEAFNYMKDRGLDLKTLIKYNIGYCPTGTYKGRILIPSYDSDGDLNYFVARSFVGHKVKYKNPEVPKENIIVNEMNINWDSTIFLVEGMFDFIGLGIKNTIPLLGKVLFNKLYSTLLEKAKGNIVILLDPDARKNAYEIYQKLDGSPLRGRIRVVDLPKDMDISDINREFGKSGVIEQLSNNRELTFKDLIKYKV